MVHLDKHIYSSYVALYNRHRHSIKIMNCSPLTNAPRTSYDKHTCSLMSKAIWRNVRSLLYNKLLTDLLTSKLSPLLKFSDDKHRISEAHGFMFDIFIGMYLRYTHILMPQFNSTTVITVEYNWTRKQQHCLLQLSIIENRCKQCLSRYTIPEPVVTT
jgi:hypothetical protein